MSAQTFEELPPVTKIDLCEDVYYTGLRRLDQHCGETIMTKPDPEFLFDSRRNKADEVWRCLSADRVWQQRPGGGARLHPGR
jgi:hypothetical protein